MNARIRQFIGIVIISALVTGQAIAEVQVQAQVDRSRPIYAGSRFSYSIIVANGDQPDTVDLSPLKAFSPSGPSTQSRTSIVNGRTSSYQILTYQLLAPDKGECTIPSVKVTVNGKNYQTNPVQISVVEPGTTKQLDVETALSAQTCYVGQPIILTTSFYIWTDIVRAEQIANIDIQVPILDDTNFYVEDVDSAPSGTTQTVLPVNGHKEYVYQDQVLHDGVNCVRVQLIKVLIPKAPGIVDVKPVSVTADLAVSVKNQSRDRFFGDIFGPQYEFQRFGTQSDPLQLTVKGLPQTGKPGDFYGLVGLYTISADATPKEVNVGDPITLTIRISGSRYLKPVQWPDLETIPEMAESFKIPSERSDGEIQNNAKVFTQTIRPNHEKVTEIPPIPLSFFDADAGRYRTVFTDPIGLQVSPTRIVTGQDVEARQFTPARKQLQAIQEGLSANYTSPDALMNQRFTLLSAVASPVFIVLYAVPFIVLSVSFFIRYIFADSPQRQAATKRRMAYSQAVKRLHRARRHEKPSQQVLAALKQYAADKFGKSAGALTAQECGDIIFEKTNNKTLAERFRDIMEQTEASEYSPIAFKLTDETFKEILGLLVAIEKDVK